MTRKTICTPQDAAREYHRLRTIAAGTFHDSLEWKEADAFARKYENSVSYTDLQTYYDELERLRS